MKKTLEKLKCNFDILKLNEDKGLVINSKSKNEKVTIYDDNLIEEMIEKKFNEKYRKLLYLIVSAVESDDATDTDFELILLKIDNFKKIFFDKYYKYLNKNLQSKYTRMILLLQDKLVIRENKHRGR